MKCQVSRQCWLQERSRFSQGKDCLQSSGSTLGLTGRKQSPLSFCKWLHKKHSPFHHHSQRGLELQGSGRSGEGLRSYSKWDAFACSVLSRWQYISDNAWLGSPPHSSWISPARDPEMKVGWAHSIPNGMLVRVPLCLLVGKAGQKPCNWYIHSSFKPSQSKGSGPISGSSDAKMKREWFLPWRNDKISREGGLRSTSLRAPLSEPPWGHSQGHRPGQVESTWCLST